MTRGFSLVELILALLIFQVGLLGVAGTVLLAQRNLLRASVTVRGVVEAGWVADSLTREGSGGSGSLSRPWGEISWGPASDGLGGLRVAALWELGGDTLAVFLAWPPVPDSLVGLSRPSVLGAVHE